MNAEFEESFVVAHTQQRDYLLDKINDYLVGIGDEGEPEGTMVLQEVKIFLENQRNFDNDNDDDKTSKTLNVTLTEIQKSLARIEGAKAVTTNSDNYAAAATRGQAAQAPPVPRSTKPTAHLKHTEPSPQEIRKAREITIVVPNTIDKEKVKNVTTKDLVETLQRETKGIRGISRLMSGDLKIHTESLEAKKLLQEKPEWVQIVAESAAIKTRTYSIRVNGVKVENIKTANQSQAIEYLQAANARLHPNLKIKKIAWSVKAIREKKTYSTLHMEVATAETANRIIAEGLVVDYEIKDCERFTKGCTMTQCFNCHKYGHIGRSCPNPTACGHCAGGHPSTECNMETTGRYRRCAACSEKGHEAWSTSCEISKSEKRKADKAMQNRVPFYPVAVPTPTVFRFQEETTVINSTDTSSKKRKTAPPPGSPPIPPKIGITWADTGIMNPENMTKALAKPVVGRPPIRPRDESTAPITPSSNASISAVSSTSQVEIMDVL